MSEVEDELPPQKVQMNEINMQTILHRLKLWSLLVFPGIGYIIGFMIRMFLAALFGWAHSSSMEIWIAHLATMSYMIGTLNNNLYDSQSPQDPKEKAFLICFTYLGLFGFILGLCPRVN